GASVPAGHNMQVKADVLVALALCLAACGGKDDRSLVTVEMANDTGLTIGDVTVTVTPSSGAGPVSQMFAWTDAKAKTLTVGVYLPATVDGPASAQASARTANGAVLQSNLVQLIVHRHGTVGPVTLTLAPGAVTDRGAVADT